MQFHEYVTYDGIGFSELIEKMHLTPSELLEMAINFIEQTRPKINAVIYKMYDAVTQSIKDGLPDGSFKGVPFMFKNLLADYADGPTSSF
jgi:amidase